MSGRTLAVSLALVVLTTGCGRGSVPADELRAAVAESSIGFRAEAIPERVTDFLAPYRVVVLGETHLIREHHRLVPELVRALHARGFRQLLLEWPHAADWQLADYLAGGELLPGWSPPESLYGQLVSGIRDFNRTVPASERVAVRGIDVNLDDYGGAQIVRDGLRVISSHLPSAGPLAAFLRARYGSEDEQSVAVDNLRAALRADRRRLVASWGEPWYATVAEMADVEAVSIRIRAGRQDDYDRSVREREDELKRLADLRIAERDAGTVVNVGGNHAQKKRLKGTSQEWLGDYLAHRSEATGGSVVSLAFVAAEIVSEPPRQFPDYDVAHASPENELFLLLHRRWPDRIAFLPFDDPLFAEDRIPLNFEGEIVVAAPRAHYDAAVVYPIAHRIRLP